MHEHLPLGWRAAAKFEGRTRPHGSYIHPRVTPARNRAPQLLSVPQPAVSQAKKLITINNDTILQCTHAYVPLWSSFRPVSAPSQPPTYRRHTELIQRSIPPQLEPGVIIIGFIYSSDIPYSQKIWRGIKFSGLAIYITTAELKFAKISYSHIILYVWQSRTEALNLNPPIV